ncbi:hypothetical protein N9K49_06950 [Flavobacteriaceae bacterium]|nr:hypothetical protein [Flavobacteriaceae bacterium]
MMPLVIAFFLSFVSPSYSELPSGSFLSFHSNEFFYIVDSDSVFVTKNGTSYDSWAHKMDWPHFDFNAIHRPNETILVAKGGGALYRFKDNSFERLDKSFEHRNKFKSFDFTFDNKIHSFGGYGLFMTNSNLTFFDGLNQEWSEFFYHPDSKIPAPRQRMFGQLEDSFLYVAGGTNKRVNEELELDYEILEDVWKLDLNTHFWSYLGKTNFDFSDNSNNLFSAATLKVSYTSGTLAISRGEVLWFDIKNNVIRKFMDVNPILVESIARIDFNPTTNLFMISKLKHNSQSYRFIFMTPLELLGSSTNEYQLYQKEIQYGLYILLTLFLLIALFFVYLKIQPKSNYSVIVKKSNTIRKELSSEDFSVLELLLKEHPTAVDFPSILTFFEPNLSYESRVKKLRLSIHRIDKVLSIYTKSKGAVLKFRQNKNDRRIKEVFLN